MLVTPAGVSASITVGNLTGALTLPVTIAGTAVIQVNTSTTAVDLTPDGGTQVKLPAGPYLRISVGNGADPVLTVGSVEFRGNVTIERSIRPGFASTSLTVDQRRDRAGRRRPGQGRPRRPRARHHRRSATACCSAA